MFTLLPIILDGSFNKVTLKIISDPVSVHPRACVVLVFELELCAL